MRALGVDLGRKRIGLAISDAGGGFAFPLDAVASAGRKRDVKTLAKLIAEREIEHVVVGLPLHMDGRAGPEAEAARAFAGELANATGREVDMLDERWTSAEAERALQAASTRKHRRESRKSGELDSMAATIILRTWLERAAQSTGDKADDRADDKADDKAEHR